MVMKRTFLFFWMLAVAGVWSATAAGRHAGDDPACQGAPLGQNQTGQPVSNEEEDETTFVPHWYLKM